MSRPTIDVMDASGLPFHLEDEPSRTRADAAEAARRARTLLEAVLLEAERASWPIEATGLKGPDDRVHRLPLSTFDGVAVMRRRDGRVQLGVTNGDAVLLTCSVHAKWTGPQHRHFAAGARLFLAAASGAIDPVAGDVAFETLRAHAARTISRGAASVEIGAALPWTDGMCSHVVVHGNDRYDTSTTWSDVMAASVSCVSTFGGIVIDVQTMRTSIRKDDLDPMEILRLLSRLEDRR